MRSHLPLLLLFCAACTTRTDKGVSQSLQSIDHHAATAAVGLRNDIHLQTKGVVVARAFVTYSDGTPVREDNVADLSRPMVLHLFVQGWQQEGGLVPLVRSQEVMDGSGAPEAAPLLPVSNGATQLLPPAAAAHLQLPLQPLDKGGLADQYQFTFRIQQPRSGQAVWGTYNCFPG